MDGSGGLERAALQSDDGILDNGMSSADKVADAETLEELDEAGRGANKLMAQINSEYTGATGRSLDPKGVTVQNGYLFDLAIMGLWHFDIAAWVSLIIAILVDALDTCIVYGMRRNAERQGWDTPGDATDDPVDAPPAAT